MGTEILFILVLGLLVLGPKQLHTLWGQASRAKTQFEEGLCGFKSQLAVELDAAQQDGKKDPSPELAETSEPPQGSSASEPQILW